VIGLLEMRAEFLGLARPSVRYCREHGLDWATIEAACGGVFLAPIRPDRSWFDFDPEGGEAAICEALADDGATVVDLVAWSLTRPDRVVTAVGAAAVLGEAVAANPATGFGGAPLRIFRTPLAWLRARCDGVVILDPTRGGRWLADVPFDTVAAEDEAHALHLDAMRRAPLERQTIVVPGPRRVPAKVAA